MTPKVSVLMPFYNQRNFLKEAIGSILTQSYQDFEFLILDDGSTDESLKIIKNIKDKKIKLFRQPKSQGLARSLNFLARRAKGDYLARMDADDVSLPNRLAEQSRFLDNNPSISLVGSWVKVINQKGRTIAKFKYPINHKEIRRMILSNNPFVHPSVMLRRSIFEKIGGYDENLTYSQDYDLFLRIIREYKGANLPKFLLKLRWLPNYAKQKQQHWTALKLRLKAIKCYGYSKLELIKIIKPLILYLIPRRLKKVYWQKKRK